MEVYSASHQSSRTMSSLLENTISCPDTEQEEQQPEKKLRPNREQSLRCPRCDSNNTKFCYYNNYSLTQPRYFCKACRRYWTQGGSLRNVPVGGGCRKNRRSSSSSLTTSSKNSQLDHEDDHITKPNSLLPALPLPPVSYDPNELSLAFATLQHQPVLDCQDNTFLVANPNPNPAPGFLDILRSGCSSSGLYYGFGAVGEVEGSGGSGVMMLPYDGGLMSSTEAVTTTTAAAAATATTASQGSVEEEADQDNKLVMGLHHYQWPVGGNHVPAIANVNANLGMDPVRDYWNNGVGSSWPWTHQQLSHLGFS